MTRKAESPLRELCRGVWPAPDAESEALRRERIAGRVLQLSEELSRRALRRRRHVWGLAAAALVGGAGGLFLVWELEPAWLVGPPVVSQLAASGGDAVRLVAGRASLSSGGALEVLAPGQLDVSNEPVVVTPADQAAEFRLSSDTALDVAPASEIGLVQRRATAGTFEERVRLVSGSVALRVPKLGKRGKVAVETRDALVEVHGTRFSVKVVPQPPLEPFTEVDVREGRVLVRAHGESRFLGPGERWSSQRRASAAPEAVAPVPEPPRRPPARAAQPDGPLSAKPAAVPTPSDLAAQNRLLEAAELAERSGMPALALERLDLLIARYPDAELAHNARVERFRVLASMGRASDAAEAARQYLDLYPRGFARAEAKRWIAAEGQEP